MPAANLALALLALLALLLAVACEQNVRLVRHAIQP
jgi:hypothetical protein